MKRSPIRKISKARARLNRQRRRNQEQAWGPHDQWRCWFRDRPFAIFTAGTCFGEVWGHEITKRSADPSAENLLDIANQVPLCNYHNGWVEDHPFDARRLGLVKSAWET